MTRKKRQDYFWEIGRRAREKFPKKLNAEAIKRLNSARQRAKTEEEQDEADCMWRMLGEHVLCAAGNYANYIETPRLFAEIRRRAGDPRACAADYDCRCPVPGEDGAPLCQKKLADCRFAGHCADPTVLENDVARANKAWLAAHQQLRRLIFSDLASGDPEKLATGLATIERALRIANARRTAKFGSGFDLATDPFYA